MSQVLVQQGKSGREIALVEDGRLVEYRVDAGGQGPQPEAVYLGKALRVMKALNAVFVRIEEGTEGFLPFDEIPGQRQPRPGDRLIVQVKKPPTGGKAAYLSGDIGLVDSLLMLLPLSQGARVSRRVTDEAERARLTALARQLAPEGMGLVMREASLQAAPELLRERLDALLAQWQAIREQAETATAPSLLSAAPDSLQALLREIKQQPERLVSNAAEAMAGYGLPTEHADQPFALWDVKGQLLKALRRRQLLKSGASLVIDPCEAMTVIDVNSAQSLQGKDRDRLILRTNLEAAQAIARLLRLRRIGGIVLIDFIDMPSEADQQALLAALERALADDPVKTVVHGFTRLGMVEMTRRRSSEPLAAQTLRRCSHCGGRGYLEEESIDG